jgi:hypothetical protein
MVPAILLLEERGYVVNADPNATTWKWSARRGDVELVGDDPIALLGLATLAEARGEAWRATDEEIRSVLGRYRMT